jgi:hypothetical protein
MTDQTPDHAALQRIVMAIDPSEVVEGRHPYLRYRPTEAELAAGRDAFRRLVARDAELAEWATEARALLAAGLHDRGIAVPHLAGPRVLAQIALAALDASGQAAESLRADLHQARTRIVQLGVEANRRIAQARSEVADAMRERWGVEQRANRLAATLREVLNELEPTPEGWSALCVDQEVADRWRAVLDEQPVNEQPARRECDALCRDIETDLDRMTPVVEAARTWRHGGGDPGYDAAQALTAAVDAYEASLTGTPCRCCDGRRTHPCGDPCYTCGGDGTNPGAGGGCRLPHGKRCVATGACSADGRPSAADVELAGPADTPLGRATVALAAWLDGCCLDLDAEELSSIVLDAAGPQYDDELERLRLGLLDRSIQPDVWAPIDATPIDTALDAIDRFLRFVQAAAEWRGRYVEAGSPDWPLHGPIATAVDELLRNWPGVDLSVPAAGADPDGLDEPQFDADDYDPDYPLDATMPCNPAGPLFATEWGVRAHHRDGTAVDHWRDSEDDARESLATIRRHVAVGDEDWTGAELIRRAAAFGPLEIVPDGPAGPSSATETTEQGMASGTGPTNPAQGN